MFWIRQLIKSSASIIRCNAKWLVEGQFPPNRKNTGPFRFWVQCLYTKRNIAKSLWQCRALSLKDTTINFQNPNGSKSGQTLVDFSQGVNFENWKRRSKLNMIFGKRYFPAEKPKLSYPKSGQFRDSYRR